MDCVVKIDLAEPDGDKWWKIHFACGHKTMSKTRSGCKKYPRKEQFCGQCWMKTDFKKGDSNE
jgi:hypothetical protein